MEIYKVSGLAENMIIETITILKTITATTPNSGMIVL